MAKMTASAGFGGLAGKVGNVVAVQTLGGTVLRQRPTGGGRRSGKQIQNGLALGYVNQAWDKLTPAQAAAWRTYAGALATRNPQTGLMRAPKAYNLFVRLGTKYLQLHGGSSVPMTPPTGAFLGDIVRVTVAGAVGQITFNADRANVAGMTTELLIQRLTGPNNVPKSDGYRSAGFVSFVGGGLASVVTTSPGPYSCAVRFVESATGRMGELMVVGQVTVG